MLSICRHTGSALCAAFAPSDLFGDQTGLHAHAIRERQNASAADDTHALFAAVAWLECSCRAADGTLSYEGRWAALIDQTALEAAVAADDAARAEAVATKLRALVAHLLPNTAPVYAPDTAPNGGAAAPETAAALASSAVTAAQLGAAAAADAASVLVLHLLTKHALPALQRAAAAEGACAASEGLREEASELCSTCCVGWSRCGWLSAPSHWRPRGHPFHTVIDEPRGHPFQPVQHEESVRAAAREAWEACVLLHAQVFCRRGHPCCLASLVDMLALDMLSLDMAALDEGMGAVLGAAAGGPPAAQHGAILASRQAQLACIGAAVGAPHLAAALAAVLNAAAVRWYTDEALLPALRLAAVMLQIHPNALCSSEPAFTALWDLAVAPFGADRSAEPESRGAGLALLRALLLLAQGGGSGSGGSGGSGGSSVVPAPGATSAHDGATSAHDGATSAHGAVIAFAAASALRQLLRQLLRPRVPSLVLAMASAISHAAPTSEIDPAARLLHTVAATFPDEWSHTMPTVVEQLVAVLEQRGRPVPAQAHKLLLRGVLKRPLWGKDLFVAMWSDLAQVTRVGVSARALARYS